MTDLVDKLKADVEKLRTAISPFCQMEKSTEDFPTGGVYFTPAESLRRQANAIDLRDAEIQAAREALAQTETGAL